MNFSNFCKLQDVCSIKIYNEKFLSNIQKFTFYIVEDTIQNLDFQQILQKNIENNIVIVNKYTKPKDGCIYNDFFVVCFDYICILYKEQITNLFPLFNQNKNSTVYFISQETENQIKQSLDAKKNQHFNISKIEQRLKNELNEFKQNFHVIFTKNVEKNKKDEIRSYWNKIIECMSLFLLKIAHRNTKIDRITHFNEIFNQKNEDKELSENDFIKLCYTNSGSSCSIDLYYYIEKEIICAVKTFNAPKETKKLFLREKQNYLDFHYPLIPKYFGTIKNLNNGNNIVLEYLEGRLLTDIKNENLPKEDLVKIILEIFLIVKYIHSKGYVYRDLKPNNFIIDENNTVFLIDFDRMIKDPSKNCSEKNDVEFTIDFNSPYFDPKITTSKKFSNEVDIYSIKKILLLDFPEEYYELLKVEFSMILSNENKNYSIDILIDKLYDNFFSKIDELKESNIIKSDVNIHDEIFHFYWFLIAEYKNPNSLFNLGLFYEYGILIWRDKYENVHYDLFDEFDRKEIQYINYEDDEVFENYTDNLIHRLSLSSIFRKQKNQINYNNIPYDSKYICWDIEKAIHYYSLAAEKNHSRAQYNLGNFYYKGKFIQKDINKAIKYFFLAANANLPEAQYQIGRFYLEKNFGNAFIYISKAAQQNLPEALNLLGLIYYEGKYISRDYDKAINFYKKAANQKIMNSLLILAFLDEDCIYLDDKFKLKFKVLSDFVLTINMYRDNSINYNIVKLLKLDENIENSEIQFLLGLCYYNGLGVPINIDKSLELFYFSANHNFLPAFLYIGNIYSNHICSSKNIEKAIYYLTISLRFKDPRSADILGDIYYNGKYVTKSIDKAIYYYSLGAKLNYAHCNYMLGFIYFKEISHRDITKSIFYFSQAANQNHIESIFHLGIIYIHDENIFNIEKAIEYFTKAANLKHSTSKLLLELISDLIKIDYENIGCMFTAAINVNKNDPKWLVILGDWYLYGKFVKFDIEKSIYYFTLASNQNNPYAQIKLGEIYLENEYYHDINKAIYYLTKAAEKNCADAQLYLGRIYSRKDFFTMDIDKAIYYYKLAADQNNMIAQYNLFLIYFLIKKNYNDALLYLRKSAKNNFPQALHYLGSIYLEGQIVIKNIDLGIHYLELAAEQNYAPSQSNLGLFYFIGKHVKHNLQKSLFYLNLAVKNGSSDAYNTLGFIYNTFYKDKKKESLNYYMNASLGNCDIACGNLAYHYFCESDINDPVNIKKGMFYLERASNLNHIESQYNLGCIYYEGLYGIKKDIKKGISYFELSSKNNYSRSHFVLGFLYHEGKNVKQDISKSIHFYKEGSNLNNAFAKNNLGILYKYGFENKVDQNIELAIEYFTEAIGILNDGVMVYNLAHLYFYMIPEKDGLNKSIDLLLKPTNYHWDLIIILRCLALIKKFGLDFEKIEIEIKEKVVGNSKEVIQTTYKFINDLQLYDDSEYQNFYLRLKNFDGLFNYKLKPIISNSIKAKSIQEMKKQNLKKNISKEFYEGFQGC